MKHTTSLAPKKRGPYLDTLYIPTCAKCGDLGEPMDRDEARTRTRNHESYVASEALAVSNAKQLEKENKQ